MSPDWNDPVDDDDEPAPRLPPGGNRRAVEVVICPRCQSTNVQRNAKIGLKSYWRCAAPGCTETWQEPPDTGTAGKGHIA